MNSLSISYGAPTESALDLETVKSDLRISGNDLDEILTSQYIPAAIEWAQGATRRRLVSTVVTWVLSDFPRPSYARPSWHYIYAMYLPGGPVSAVGGIEYVSNGSPVTLSGPSSSPAGTGYQESIGESMPRLLPPQGETWPDVDLDAIEPVKVTYTAGWADAASVPEDIKRALTANIFQSMELDGLLTVKVGDRASADMDFADRLISPYRSPRA